VRKRQEKAVTIKLAFRTIIEVKINELNGARLIGILIPKMSNIDEDESNDNIVIQPKTTL
jgi:hypothetical protein